jgi:hypothetical protein
MTPMDKFLGSPGSRKVLAELLDRAAQEFSNHGCNDLTLPNEDWAWEIVRMMEEDNYGVPFEEIPVEDRPVRPPPGKHIYYYDWVLLGTLSRILSGKFRAP